MFTSHIQDYGYGWFVADLTLEKRKVKMIEHGGAIFGFITGFRRLPEERYTVIVMDNTSGPRVTELVDGITRILYDLPVPDPTLSIARTIGGIIDRDGVAAATARFREIRSSSAAGYDFDESEMNLLGYEYLRRHQIDRAIAIFQMNIEAHPDAFNTYDSMGEALLAAGDSARAIASYRKALELNPASQSARAALLRLGVDVPAESSVTVTLPEATLRSYVGNYAIAPTFVIAVTYEGGKLMAQATGQTKLELRAVSETMFSVVSVDAQILFNRNDSGTIESLTLLQNGRSIPGKRME
jgi:tetratricopeptide (TPR) repeat protein